MDPVTDRSEKVRVMGAVNQAADALFTATDRLTATATFSMWDRLLGVPGKARSFYTRGWLDGITYEMDQNAKRRAVPVRPYLGQRVLYHLTNKPGFVPMAAIVCQVHSGVEVAVVAFTPEGVPLSPAATHVGYIHNHQELPDMTGHFCVPISEEDVH